MKTIFPLASYAGSWRFSVAPMMDWTDRHCRYFHRLLTRQALLYTEMVTTGALLHGDQARHLDFSEQEHPLALQLGGSEPADLAKCTDLAAKWGYDEVNLNCGCPSERVQRGAFGACLMAEPKLVADCVAAMKAAQPAMPVTVKHRIGLERSEEYGFVRDFVGTVSQGGCTHFIVHARNAWLKGLSPKENRNVPPLRYEVIERLACDFPQLTFSLNGGLRTHEQIAALGWAKEALAGVMIGRAAYENPALLREVDALYFSSEANIAEPLVWRAAVVEQLIAYASLQQAQGVPPRPLTRHVLGLFHGLPGGRLWRRELSAGEHAGVNAAKALQCALAIVLEANAFTRGSITARQAGGISANSIIAP
jgi:tRNA-dihydrouridine synthase A